MLISFVIPVYNAAEYLGLCLTSILKQSYKNLEVIVIDDCSTDNSYQIIEKFQKSDDRVRVFRNAQNSLVGASRNLGIRKAAGNYIWFVDADDWLNSNSIFELVSILKREPGIDLILFGYIEHYSESENEQNVQLPKRIASTEDIFIHFLFLRKGFRSMPFIYVFSRDFLLMNNLEFPEKVYFEDILFTSKAIYYSRKIKVLPEVFYVYNRNNQNAITRSFSKKKILDLLKTYDLLKDFLEGEDVLEKYQAALVIRFLVFGLSRCFKMYFLLPLSERKDLIFRSKLFSFRKSDLMGRLAFNSVLIFLKTLGTDELQLKREYYRNIKYLFWVKNTLIPLKLLMNLSRIYHRLKDSRTSKI
ncbi:glycosyltransferase family 2 protein [Ulvibacterium sp.]|uniref:glycosyltransferase family 2 protein n=1 Tax=Ulvibacterium sp. TaxID=2665914 RepID=UPI002609FF47|nr:glycosyltransferase family 2 protein [Ulvibacterium sp.]